jgi:hypothetical protein
MLSIQHDVRPYNSLQRLIDDAAKPTQPVRDWSQLLGSWRRDGVAIRSYHKITNGT